MNVLLTQGNINNNVYLYFSTQRPSAMETNQIEQADVVGFRPALLHEFINL